MRRALAVKMAGFLDDRRRMILENTLMELRAVLSAAVPQPAVAFAQTTRVGLRFTHNCM